MKGMEVCFARRFSSATPSGFQSETEKKPAWIAGADKSVVAPSFSLPDRPGAR